jgi:hypothetical protein
MYKPLPLVTEALDELDARSKRERDGQRRPRLHLLVLLRFGRIQRRQEAATHLTAPPQYHWPVAEGLPGGRAGEAPCASTFPYSSMQLLLMLPSAARA